jgi:RES domain-containing protein
MRIWRLTRARHRDEALHGIGARRFGGRWNSMGTAVGYASSSLELAVLEAVVQVRPEELVAADYWWLEFSVPDDAVVKLERLPANWDAPGPHAQAAQEAGDRWAASQQSLALRVPAAVLPERANILVNPKHARFREVRQVGSGRFTWPRRLLDYLQRLPA